MRPELHARVKCPLSGRFKPKVEFIDRF